MKRRSINRWITRCFIVILFLSVLASAAANMYEAYSGTIREGSDYAAACGANVRNLLNHQWSLDEISQLDGRVYREARHSLNSICDTYYLDYLFIYNAEAKTPSRYIFVFGSSEPENDDYIEQELTQRSLPAKQLTQEEQALLEGTAQNAKGFHHTPLGDMYIWTVPYLDKSGTPLAMISMCLSMDGIWQLTLRSFFMDIIPFIISLSLGLLILLLLVRRRIVVPINAISESMKRFALDSRSKPEPLHIAFRDEIGDIARSYEKMTEDISAYVSNIEALTHERVENNVQLEVARRIQNGLVPEKTSLRGDGFDVCAMTRPAKAVGGDFYDCFQLDQNSVCVMMGDVSGKGVSAAIFMAMIKTMIRQKLMDGLSPAEALNKTNTEICAQNPENLFATAFAATLNLSTGALRFANAGHNYPVLLKKNPEYLRPDEGIALGMFEDANLMEETLILAPGEGILLYTDGVTEAVNPENAFFGMDRLLDTVKAVPEGSRSAKEILLAVTRAVGAFCEGSEPFDDMATLALFREAMAAGKDQAASGKQALPLALSAFDTVRDAVIAIAGDAPKTRQLLLACDEWIANVVSYSQAAHFAFSCEPQANGLKLTFYDDGVPFDPLAQQKETDDFEALEQGGMGLNIIRQSASQIHYARQNGCNELTLYFA